jgi:thiopeptide-type bacteriocin biosynthesis protein
LQVDLTKSSPHATLGHAPIAEILRGVEILRRLAPPSLAVRRFVEAFAARYGDAEVPLLEALDEDTGIGFEVSMSPSADAAPLVQGLSFPVGERSARFGPREALLLRRVEALQRTRETVLELSSDDLERLSARESSPLPLAFAVVASIAARSSEAIARGEFRVVLDRVTGPSGVHPIAGQCHDDDVLRARVAAHLRAEEALRPDALFAEIVHLPAGPFGNDVVRPVLRSHEIVYLGRSGAPDEVQLPVTDLTISIDPDEQIVLRSTRLGREIIPRLTIPHDHADPPALGVYRFLCALQHQGSATELRFRWGALDGLGFLPRVQVGRVILARARWRLFADQLQTLVEPGMSRFAAVQRLRAELAIPRCVELEDGDHHLTLDLDNPLCIDVLGDQVKHRSEARLLEVYPLPDELCAVGPEGRFVHELVIPFVRDAAPRVATRRSVVRDAVVDRFTPGTEWVQLNLYAASSAADDVLRALVAPQVAHALRSVTADRWFFVRYSQPDWHLRLFLHGEPAALLTGVVPSLHAAAAALLQDGRLWKLQVDTYRREVGRYGGPEGIEIAEAIFQADSEAVLGIVELLEGDDGEHARWRLGLRGIDLLLSDLGLELSDKRELMRTLRASFVQTLGVEPRLEHQLSANYRRERGSLEALLDPANDQASDLAPGIELLHERSRKLVPFVRELDARGRAGRLSQTIHELARSYVHMFTNRLFRCAALSQELVLYDWLGRLYESNLARRRKAT